MMFDKGKRERRNQEEDAVFNRMLLWLAGAVAVELLILLVQNIYINMLFGSEVALALSQFFYVFGFAGAALTAAGLVWALVCFRGKKPVVLPLAVTGAAAILWAISLLTFYLNEAGLRVLLTLPAAGALLILIFFLYQRAFFFNALLTGGGLLALWLHRQYYMTHPTFITACIVGGVAVLAIAAVLAFLLQKSDGKLGKCRVMPVGSNYVMTWATCAVTAVLMVLALVLGVSMSHYLLYGLVGWLFAQAVFFTVKMM